MAHRLTDMNIIEISLVDEPANDDARVMIVKARDLAPATTLSPSTIAAAVLNAIEGMAPEIVEKAAGFLPTGNSHAAEIAADHIKEIIMDLEQLTKALEAANTEIETLDKAKTDAETRADAAEALAKAKGDELDAIAKAKQDPAEAEAELLKSLPESIRKRLAEADEKAATAEAELQKSKDKAERDTFIAKAKELNVGDAETVGDLLMRVSKGKTTEADAAIVETVLKTAVRATEASDLFKTLGKVEEKELSVEDQIVAKAKALQAAEPELSFAKAYDLAITQNPDLYNQYIAKRR